MNDLRFCRRPILSGLLCLLWFFYLFRVGPRTFCRTFYYLFCQVFESLCVSYVFHVNCRFMSNCYLCLNVFFVKSCWVVLFHVSRVNFCSRQVLFDFDESCLFNFVPRLIMFRI